MRTKVVILVTDMELETADDEVTVRGDIESLTVGMEETTVDLAHIDDVVRRRGPLVLQQHGSKFIVIRDVSIIHTGKTSSATGDNVASALGALDIALSEQVMSVPPVPQPAVPGYPPQVVPPPASPPIGFSAFVAKWGNLAIIREGFGTVRAEHRHGMQTLIGHGSDADAALCCLKVLLDQEKLTPYG